MSNWNKEINDGGGKGIPMYTGHCKCGRECAIRQILISKPNGRVYRESFGAVGSVKRDKDGNTTELSLHAGNNTFIGWLELCTSCFYTDGKPAEAAPSGSETWRAKDWLEALHISAAKPSAKERQRQESIERQKRRDER